MGWGSLGLIGPILSVMFFVGLLAVLGLGSAWLARQFGRRPATSPPMEVDPLAIARRRLGAREVSLAEFEEIRERLRH